MFWSWSWFEEKGDGMHENERSNLNVKLIAWKYFGSCDVLELEESFRETCFGHFFLNLVNIPLEMKKFTNGSNMWTLNTISMDLARLKYDVLLIVQYLELVTQMDYVGFCFKEKCFMLHKTNKCIGIMSCSLKKIN